LCGVRLVGQPCEGGSDGVGRHGIIAGHCNCELWYLPCFVEGQKLPSGHGGAYVAPRSSGLPVLIKRSMLKRNDVALLRAVPEGHGNATQEIAPGDHAHHRLPW
jgi:hypothetical protein